jgi:hypothetical protein
VIKSLGGNVKMLVTNPKEEEESAKKKKDGRFCKHSAVEPDDF